MNVQTHMFYYRWRPLNSAGGGEGGKLITNTGPCVPGLGAEGMVTGYAHTLWRLSLGGSYVVGVVLLLPMIFGFEA